LRLAPTKERKIANANSISIERIYPMSQSEKILYHLSSGKSITPIEALQSYGCFRLASRISELKREGHDIVTNIKETWTQEGGLKRYAEYRLRIADKLGEI
jgi:hypothetical protein